MKTKHLFLLFAVFFCFNSCTSLFQNRYVGLWFYTYSSGESALGFKLTPASFLCLHPDKSFTLDFGSFQHGNWIVNGDTLILTGSKKYYFLVNDISGTDMKLAPEPGLKCDFVKLPYSFAEGASEPFSLTDNQWRIPATAKETPVQLKARLINHCRFWKDYFTWALNSNVNAIDVRSTPTPIKIYGNGVTLKTFEDLPLSWRSYFYDTADCKQASAMLQNMFEHNDIAWAQTDDKYKMFISAFEQMERLMQNH